MSRIRMKSTLVAATLAAFVVTTAAQTPVVVPKNKYSPADDVKLGQEAAQQVEKELPVMRDDADQRLPEQHRTPARRVRSRPSSVIPSSATRSPA